MKKSRQLPVLIANAYSASRPTFGILRAFSDYSFGVLEPERYLVGIICLRM